MAVTVYVPTMYRGLAVGEARVRAVGRDLAEVVADLEAGHPGFRERICEGAEIRPYVNVYVNGGEVRGLQGMWTPVRDGDEVVIFPVVAGE